MFVKGNLSLEIDGKLYHFVHQSISTFGVTTLPWSGLSPVEHFGRSIFAEVKMDSPEKLRIKTPAQILREFTHNATSMGIRFHLNHDEHEELHHFIQKHGHLSTEYIRKYPRIPSDEMIQTFPLRASLFTNLTGALKPIIFDVENLSPNGILVASENSMALDLKPGSRVSITLDPRGWFPVQIHLTGLVCRILDELRLESRNVVRRIGIKFTKVEEADKKAFIDLLKDILTQLKQRN